MPLIVTGTIGIDTVHTPTGKAEGVLGGSCSYFAAAASFLSPVRVVAAVGGDWPSDHREKLRSLNNINLDGLEERPDSQTFAWGGRYFDNMNRRETLFTELGVLEETPPAVPATYADSGFVFLANTHPSVQMGLLEQFPNRKLAVADTMDLWINIANDELHDLFQKIDGVVINDEEAMQLTEIANPISAAKAILKLGPKFVIIKKGEHGCVLVHADGIAALPAYPAGVEQVIDPTGAGDSFAGGLMGHIASSDSLAFETIQQGLAAGTVMASFTIESFGLDRLLTLDRSEFDQRLAGFRTMVRI